MDIFRTPDSRFEHLAVYPFAPHYLDVAASDTPLGTADVLRR